MANHNEFSDREIFELIEKGEAIHRLEENEDFKLLQKAWKRLSEMALDHLVKTDAKDIELIHELQTIIKFYRNVLGSTLDSIKYEGHVAFEEATERGLIGEPDTEENP